MVVDWEQETGLLMTSGDVRIIRIWDTDREMKVQVPAVCSSLLEPVPWHSAPELLGLLWKELPAPGAPASQLPLPCFPPSLLPWPREGQ